MYCSKCGKELPNEADFCGYCGSSVNKENQQSDIIEKTQITEPLNETHKPKNKKLIAITSIIVALSLLLGCTFLFLNSKNNFKTIDDSIIGNMNEVKWFLKTHYDITDISKVRFYDGLTTDEASFIFVQLPSETRNPEDGIFLVFAYDASIADGIKLYENNNPYVENDRLSLALGDDVTFWDIPMYDPHGNKQNMYITFDKNDKVQRILLSRYVFDYEYDDKNRVTKLICSEANEDSWDSNELYGSVFIHNEITEERSYEYHYRTDGKLEKVMATSDADMFSEDEIRDYEEVAGKSNYTLTNDKFTWCFRYFSYVDSKRAAASDYFTTISIQYRQDGYIDYEDLYFQQKDEHIRIHYLYSGIGYVESDRGY